MRKKKGWMPILASKIRPCECSFTMIISAWWLWTSGKFSEQKFEKIHRNIARSREPLNMCGVPKHKVQLPQWKMCGSSNCLLLTLSGDRRTNMCNNNIISITKKFMRFKTLSHLNLKNNRWVLLLACSCEKKVSKFWCCAKILVKRQKLVFCFTGKKLKARIQLRYLLLIYTVVFIQTSKKLIWRVLYFNPVGVKLWAYENPRFICNKNPLPHLPIIYVQYA